VASLAGGGRRLVKEHHLVINGLLERVAGCAGNILMAALERKRGLLVIEERWAPFVVVVACGTVVGLRAELARMRILVALIANLGGIGETNMQHGQLHVRRLVAIGAGQSAVRANQWEGGLGVVEPGQILPLLCRVAGQAPQGCAFGIDRRHAFRELTVVNVLVATGAAQMAEMIKRNLGTGRRLVAFIAGHCQVSAVEREA